ncbi:MAG: hypothetical protein ACKOW9_04980 [Candidatus Paceibacterota bacterium]
MGSLSDAAKRGFRKGIKRSSVPEWMLLAQWVALGFIPVIVVLSLFQSDAVIIEKPPKTSEVVSDLNNNDLSSSSVSDSIVSIKTVNGKSVKVSQEAVDTAKKAGLAIWTGVWDDVPISGNPAYNESLYPNARIGSLMVFSLTDDVITFVIKLDTRGDGSYDQSFQISVVKETGRWVYLV